MAPPAVRRSITNFGTTGNGVSVIASPLVKLPFAGAVLVAIAWAIAWVIAGMMLGAGSAKAATSDWWRTEHGAVRLVSASDGAGQAETLRFGLHFKMNKGWKIYWRSPGDAGFPPQPNWAGSRNLAEARLDWPAPKRFSVLGLQTLGYSGEVVLPVAASVFEPGKPLLLRAKVPYLTCAEICVPYEADLAIDIPAGPETSAIEGGLIETYRALVPRTDGTGPLRIASAAAVGGATTRTLEIRLSADAPLSKPDIYVEGAEGWAFGAPQYKVGSDGKSAWLRIEAQAPPKTVESLVGRTVRLTAVDGARSIESAVVLRAAVSAVGPVAPVSPPGQNFVVILLLAVVGGLILNLMPCVLPVLSLKLLSVVGHGGGEARAVRTGFLASSAGILASFFVLGSVAVGLRLAGLSAGWGIQFQQPLFLAFMAVVVALFAANLFGLFEIRLPGAVSDLAAGAGGHGGHGSHGMGGHFLTGAFATLLATPCSAPFLGTAVGFALSRGPVEIYAVFLALGVGLSLPYLAVAAFPGLATRLPRPGPWMVTLRRVLGIALAATAIWLLSVIAVQIGIERAVVIGLALVVLSGGLALAGSRSRGRSGAGIAVSAAAVVTVLALAIWPGTAPIRDTVAGGHWTPFDQARIAREVADGRVVFVDVTADWCITCQVNKALVLKTSPVREQLAGNRVSAMVADWTWPNAEIAAYLESFGRYGIPFNVVYGPGSPTGEPLPEILTKRAVMNALSRATGAARTSVTTR